ncbi:MAG: hypothetical protein L0207_01325 [Chlamydiae bacterium]|nr:hypothetical protein [Chlamydiota bacterium]
MNQTEQIVCPEFSEIAPKSSAISEVRAKTLKAWDKFLSWTFSMKNREYTLFYPTQMEEFETGEKKFSEFSEYFGYFSQIKPLVGSVTKDEEDIFITNCILRLIHDEVSHVPQKILTTEEILAKVLAYRALKKGDEVAFSTLDPEGKNRYVTYLVDEIIDLWRGMPAFGLVAKDQGINHSVLLFRGTDLSLTTEKGWASILSDLDLSGPGFSTFKKAAPKIESWLKKMKDSGTPARALGMSLGGVFAAYTTLFFPDLLIHDHRFPSIGFNAPGISKHLLEEQPSKKKSLYLSFS